MRSYFDGNSIQVKDKLIASQGFYRVAGNKKNKKTLFIGKHTIVKKIKLSFIGTFND